MRYILLFLSLFTFIFSKDKEVENEMAIPSGYRAITSADIGKTFGNQLEGIVYFDSTKSASPYSNFTRLDLADDSYSSDRVHTYEQEIEGTTFDVYGYYAPSANYELFLWNIGEESGYWENDYLDLNGKHIYAIYDPNYTTIYVKDKNAVYSITFEENGGTAVSDLTDQSNLPNPLPSTTKSGYTFSGWYLNSALTLSATAGASLSSNTTLYAKWVINVYNITWNANGGSAVSQTTGVNAFPSPLPTSTKAGSTFAGWWNSALTIQYSAGQTIQGNITAYAKWIVNSYTVTWVENGGTPAPDDLTDVASLPSPLPVITKTGYELDGWYFNSLFTGSKATPGQLITQNETLYAKFVRVSYVIGYELDGGTNNLGNPDEYNVESPTITLLDPSKAGYTFNGWFSDAEKTTPITSIPTGTTGDITIYASFTLSETGYSITWVENGGTPEQTDLTNQNYLPSVLPALIKTGYVFKGWFTNEALTIAAAPSALIGENTTLYAKFEVQATPKKGYIRVEPIDTALSAVSKKPLQNKAIYAELNLKVEKVEGKSLVSDTEIAHLEALDTQAELDIKFGAKEDIANKGVANGYAPLNASGIIDPIYVPSAYTDYVEYATYADLPATGVEGTLYVVIADETSGGNTSTYRWTGSIYVNVTDKLSASEVKALYESNADTNAYTDEEKTKLTGIEALAEVNIVEGVKVDNVLLTPDVDRIVNVDLSGKVDKVEGKALSTNDYTDEEKSLVASISLKNAEQDKQIATIEENLRRVNNGEVSATAVGERVIHLGKDVANAPLKVETEGLLLNAPNQLNLASTTQDGITITVSGNQITLSGTASADTDIVLTNLLTIGNKAYVNYDYVSGTFTGTFALINDTSLHSTYNSDYSGVITVAHANVIISLASGSVATSLIIKINIDKVTSLITNKQYSPLYSKTFDTMTDAEIKAQMDLWVLNGTLPNDLMGVDFNKRFTSVGKNLIDTSKLELGVLSVSDGLPLSNDKAFRTSEFISVSPNTSYTLSWVNYGNDLLMTRLFEYTDNGNYIKYIQASSGTHKSITTSSTTNKIKVVYYANSTVSIGDVLNNEYKVQLELGAVATTYVPFVKSEMYIAPNVKGYRLPNGIKDTIEFRDGKAYKVIRIATQTLLAGNITALTNGTYVQYATVALSVFSPTVKTQSTILADGSFVITGFDKELVGDVSIDAAGNENTFETSDINLFLIKSLSTYADLAAAQAALAGTVIYYQLATPITTEIDADGVLNGYENGTVYVENAMKDMAIYNSGFTITNTNYPISELETIIKIDKITGLQTVYSASTAVIAGDKLSFTHSSLANGDLVYITYKYLSPLMSNTTITFIDNKQVVLGTGSSAGKYFKITPSVVDGAIVWVATEV